jgi:hypothetical protein
MRALGADSGRRCNDPARPAPPACSTAAAAPAMNPSRITGMRRHARRQVAPAMAAISRPPRRRSTSSGSSHGRHGGQARGHHRVLARKTGVIDPGAPPGPFARCRRTARSERGGGGGVADPHLAHHQQIGLRIDRLPAGASAATSSASVIAGPWVKSAVGRSSSSAMHRHFGAEGADSWLIAAPPARKFATICTVTSAGKAETPRAADPMVAGKDRTCGRSSAGARCRASRPPDRQILQPAQRARRFGQHRVARPRRGHGRRVGAGQVRHQGTKIGNGFGRVHRLSFGG